METTRRGFRGRRIKAFRRTFEVTLHGAGGRARVYEVTRSGTLRRIRNPEIARAVIEEFNNQHDAQWRQIDNLFPGGTKR